VIGIVIYLIYIASAAIPSLGREKAFQFALNVAFKFALVNGIMPPGLCIVISYSPSFPPEEGTTVGADSRLRRKALRKRLPLSRD
jgi:hypothetical protein